MLSTYTPGNGLEKPYYLIAREGAACGFISGLGGACGGGIALMYKSSPFFIPATAIGSSIGGFTWSALALGKAIYLAKDSLIKFQASDYIAFGLISSAAILASTATMSGGATIIVAANMTEAAAAGLTMGTSITSTLFTAPLAGLLGSLGVFKAKEYFNARNIEDNDVTATSSLTMKS